MLYPYRYIKARRKPARSSSIVVSILLMVFGTSVLMWVIWPILTFSLVSEGIFAQIISPVGNVPAKAFEKTEDNPTFLVNSTAGTPGLGQADLTNANAWFPSAPQKKVVTPVNSYILSIPKLNISNALVIIGGYDLNKSLIHYGGTGLPGQYGTTVVFGHSTLPQFYSPTDYKTIFSLLPTLKIGDDVWVTYDKISYHYIVEEMIVTEPNDLTPLVQRFDDSYLTLITCVPPGTYWKRLNVRARLQKI